jgi:hypothetical protein
VCLYTVIDGSENYRLHKLYSVVLRIRLREISGIPAVGSGEFIAEYCSDFIPFRHEILGFYEDHDPWSPVVVGRHLSVEFKHFRATT